MLGLEMGLTISQNRIDRNGPQTKKQFARARYDDASDCDTEDQPPQSYCIDLGSLVPRPS